MNAVVLNTHIGYFQILFHTQKVPDGGIQNDRIQTTITMQQTKKRSEFVSPRKRPETVQICTTDHYDQILEGFSRFLGPANSAFCLLHCDRGLNAVVLSTFKQLEFKLLLRFFKFLNCDPGS